MATETREDAGSPPIEAENPTTEAEWKPYRLSVKQFKAMIDAGIFPHDAHVELLGGVLVQMMVKGDPHDNSLDALSEALRRMTPEGWLHREDKSLQLGPYSRPEPDIAIVRGPRSQFFTRTPHARETALVVEVAASSYPYDRGTKWRAYAAARVPIYWIVNLDKSQIEVYRNPSGRGSTALYRESAVFGIGSEAPVIIDGHEVGRLAVRDILP
jgi:Uma2 family endonuclease